MAHTAFADAAKRIDEFQKQRNSPVPKKNQTVIVKLQLRFLSRFLRYTVIRCTDYEYVSDLLKSFKDLELTVENLLQVLPCLGEEPAYVLHEAVVGVLDQFQLIKPEIIHVQMQVSTLSASGSRMNDELVFEFLDSVLGDLKELVGCNAGLIQPSLNQGFKLLKMKLTLLKGLLRFTAKRFNDLDKLNQLFNFVQVTADTAAYLAYSCLTSRMDDDDLASTLALQLSDLVQRIYPEDREIYVGVSRASKSSETKSDTCEMDETLLDSVNSLLEKTLEILYRRHNITVKGQIEILYEELKSFKYLLKDAEKLTDHGNSNDLLAKKEVFWKDQRHILKLELRNLIRFLKNTADRCTDYENWQQILILIEDAGQSINKLRRLLASPVQLNTLASLLQNVDDAIRHVLDNVKLVKQEVKHVVLRISILSSSPTSDELVFETIDSLKKLLGSMAVGLVQPSLKEEVQVLKKKLSFLKGLLRFTTKRCSECHKLNELFTHAQAVADAATYLVYSCPINKMDEDMTSRWVLQLSDLVLWIDPVKPQVQEIYVGALEASKSSESKSNTYEMDESLVDFVDVLLESTWKLLDHDTMSMKDQIELLYEELKSYRFLLKDAERLAKHGNSNDLLAKMEDFAIEAGSVIFSPFKDELNQEMRLALSKLLDNFKLVSEIHVRSSAKARISNLPTIGVLGTLGLLLRDLKELLNASNDSINLLKDHILIVHRDMEFLGSFLTTTEKQRHEHEKLEDFWRRIIHVIYEVEYVIDSVVTDGPVMHHKFWLSYLIEEIKLIKTKISEIQISEKNTCSLQEHHDRMISSRHVLSQKGAPRIDEEMVGFKDEEEKLIEQLVGGSEKLQIVSIVGMAGLGKTFLAQKIYNNPIIKNHFYVHAWSSISQVYQRRDLLINILSQLKKFTEETSKMTDEELAGELHKCLKRQKYLIVLDDMWDIGAWKALRRSFPDDNNGSIIVFTSRFHKLAMEAKSDSKIHQLRSFFDNESWELLKKKIFQIESCPSELLEVGQHISKCCKGLPLAIVVVAGLLAKKTKKLDQWKEVANSLSSHIISDPQRKCMDILDLSYKNLPDYLKPCFLYLGTFPEDKEIPVNQLTWLWIAEGLVQDKAASLECIAEGYLMDLIGKNLVIASKERSPNGLKTCILHDLVREFCLVKAREENFFMLMEGSDDLPNVPISYGRRLLVHIEEGKLNGSKSFGPYARALLFTVSGYMYFPTYALESIIHRHRLLRVLHLVNVVFNRFPEGIESLVLLRYLAIRILSNGVVPPLPIASLPSLETLIIIGGYESVFGDIFFNLTKLRHLHVDSLSLSCASSFDEFFRLDTLQTLSGLSLSYDSNMDIMRRFPNLRKLSCKFKVWDSSTECNWLPALDFLSQLESLKVSYFGLMSLSQQMWDACGLSLPSNIRKLTMSDFRLPWAKISTIAKLPNLEVLKLLSDAFEGEQWNMQEGGFHKLKVLKLSSLNIQRWVAYEDNFPSIEQLLVTYCYLLEEIPSCLEDIPTLKVIKIHCYNDSLKIAVNQIEEEQRDTGNELEVEITDMTSRAH